MALTYIAIATTTVGSGGASSLEFTNITQTYTDLLLTISGRLTGNLSYQGTIEITLNNSTSGYSRRGMSGDGSTVSSYSVTSGSIIANVLASTSGSGQTASTFGNAMIYIPNYTSSNHKTVSIDTVAENASSESYSSLLGARWANTAAITSIKFTPEGGYGNLAQHTSATLYGIKNTV